MSAQEKRPVSLRLPADLLAWAEEYGRSMRWDRTTVIVAALESFREDVAGGVPERPGLEEASSGPPVVAAPASERRTPRRPVTPSSPAPPRVPGVVRASALV